MTNSVLITGGTGLIGRRLTEALLQKGCRVAHLGREKRKGPVPSWTWDLVGGTIEAGAFNGIDTIVHLAGAGIGEKRWTAARKMEIESSRTRSSEVLYQYLKMNRHSVRTVVAASAIGYYGSSLSNKLLTEESPQGTDFLASVVVNWEKATDRLGELGLRVVKIRTGIVLSREGGALKELMRPIKWGAGAALGSGRQMMSWIHIDDLCEMFAMAIESESMKGAYNATTPSPVSNKEMTVSIARTLNRKVYLPNVPGILLRLLLGEMADMVLLGSNVSGAKIQKAGFQFKFPELTGALNELIGRPTT